MTMESASRKKGNTGKQRQAELCEFDASLDYILSSRTARATLERTPITKQTNKQAKSNLIS